MRYAALADEPVAFVCPHHIMLGGKAVKSHEPDVMARVGVFVADIS